MLHEISNVVLKVSFRKICLRWNTLEEFVDRKVMWRLVPSYQARFRPGRPLPVDERENNLIG